MTATDRALCLIRSSRGAFGGSGTVGLVADRLRRDAILIELNPTYADMARRRIREDAPLLTKVCGRLRSIMAQSLGKRRRALSAAKLVGIVVAGCIATHNGLVFKPKKALAEPYVSFDAKRILREGSQNYSKCDDKSYDCDRISRRPLPKGFIFLVVGTFFVGFCGTWCVFKWLRWL